MWTDRRSGHEHQRSQQDHRDPYERDRNRVIHCSAFRRLQRKTQILGTNEGDFHRTRLTHSLEVASIGVSIARRLALTPLARFLESLLPHDDLVQAICLAHDMGHPPFGHGGETALNYMMRDHGGFEGNGQTLRILSQHETSYSPYGLDLTRRTLLGILKYPVSHSRVVRAQQGTLSSRQPLCINHWVPPKAYLDCDTPQVVWLLSIFSQDDQELFQAITEPASTQHHAKACYHGFDCSIMNIADDIAYGVHDMEDAIHLHLMRREQFDTPHCRHLFSEAGLAQSLMHGLFDEALDVRKQSIGELVNYFITSVQVKVSHDAFNAPLLKYNAVLVPEARALLDYCMQCIYDGVIDSPQARAFEHGGQRVILTLFEAIVSNPKSLLDLKNRRLFDEAGDEDSAWRVVCDFIADMTDDVAYRMHQRLMGLNTRALFE